MQIKDIRRDGPVWTPILESICRGGVANLDILSIYTDGLFLYTKMEGGTMWDSQNVSIFFKLNNDCSGF